MKLTPRTQKLKRSLSDTSEIIYSPETPSKTSMSMESILPASTLALTSSSPPVPTSVTGLKIRESLKSQHEALRLSVEDCGGKKNYIKKKFKTSMNHKRKAATGAGIGGAIGFLCGPLAPIAIPAGVVIGGAVGSVLGDMEVDDVTLPEVMTKEDEEELKNDIFNTIATPSPPSEDVYRFPPSRNVPIFRSDELVDLKLPPPKPTCSKDLILYSHIKDLLLNFRDISLATSKGSGFPIIKSNTVYRSSCVSRSGCSVEEVKAIMSFIRYTVKIRTMIDLRDPEEKIKDRSDILVKRMYPNVKFGSKTAKNFKYKRYNIPAFTLLLKVKGLFWEGSDANTKMQLVSEAFKNGVSGAERAFMKKAMSPKGLAGLNKLILVHATEQILRILELFLDPTNFPIMYHCSLGKDRTGLVTALILLTCGVCREDVVENYRLSEDHLESISHVITYENTTRGLSDHFSYSPKSVMEETIDFLELWGGCSEYLKSIGFGTAKQQLLRKNLLVEQPKINSPTLNNINKNPTVLTDQ